MRLFKFCYQCQNLTIEEQLNMGVRYFDIRIRLDKNEDWVFAHGMVEFKNCKMFSIFKLINQTKNCTVRLVLELDKVDELQEIEFKDYCKSISVVFSNINFVGGCAKYDWNTKIYDFGNTVSKESQYKSYFGKAIYPKWYAIKNNKKNKQKGTDKDFLVLDFVEKG